MQQFDVYYLSKPHAPRKGEPYEVVCSFGEGYAVLLAQHFSSMNEEAGKTIVFIDWAHFGGDDLKLLTQVIARVRKRMVVKEESWDVLIGWNEVRKGKGKRDIYSRVTKGKMNLLLEQLDAAIQRAKATGRYVSFNFWGGGG